MQKMKSMRKSINILKQSLINFNKIEFPREKKSN